MVKLGCKNAKLFFMVPPNRISGIVNGKRAITADTALRLQLYFKIEAQFVTFRGIDEFKKDLLGVIV